MGSGAATRGARGSHHTTTQLQHIGGFEHSVTGIAGGACPVDDGGDEIGHGRDTLEHDACVFMYLVSVFTGILDEACAAS